MYSLYLYNTLHSISLDFLSLHSALQTYSLGLMIYLSAVYPAYNHLITLCLAAYTNTLLHIYLHTSNSHGQLNYYSRTLIPYLSHLSLPYIYLTSACTAYSSQMYTLLCPLHYSMHNLLLLYYLSHYYTPLLLASSLICSAHL